MQRTHRGVALDTVFDENGTRCGKTICTLGYLKCSNLLDHGIFTIRNSSCGKVMLSQVSVCPHGGGVHTLPADTPGQTPPPREDRLPRQTPPDGYCSGRYACYWNVFLLNEKLFSLIIKL